MKTKVEITKCYLVQILDEEGNEIRCEYVFGDKEYAKQRGKEMRKEKENESTH